jgi:NADPH-dependent curcumin reductase CurA
MKSKQVILAALPRGMVKETDLRVEEREVEIAVEPHDVAVKLLYIGVEPYYRELMAEVDTLGFGLFKVGQAIWGRAVGQVVESANSEFEAGDLVLGTMEFSEYVVVQKGQGLEKVDASQVPPSYYLGILGMPGLTAWIGLKLIGNPKSGEQVFVSAASGAVGQIVGQLAKVYGCRAVGSAGSDEKVELLKSEFGFDDAFNYKKEKDLGAALKKYFPKGIDVYFDNVGGEMLDAMLKNANRDARIAVCGAISQYNLEEDKRCGIKNLFNLVGKCIKMEGFLEGKFHDQYIETYRKEMRIYIKEGKVKYKEHVTQGIENFPTAFVGLMKGHNVGKSVLHF